jgi:CRP/FNR family transcriptional regulator, cyclic AMP receptor protein
MNRVQYILGTLDDEDIDWLVAAGQRQELKPREILIEAGRPNDSIFLILEGLFAVFKGPLDHPASSIDHTIAYLASGEVAGEMSFIDAYPPSASVRAVEPSLVLVISKSVLSTKLHHDICFASRFYHAMALLLSLRLRGAIQQIDRPLELMPEIDCASYDFDMAETFSLGKIRYDWLLRRLRYSSGHFV